VIRLQVDLLVDTERMQEVSVLESKAEAILHRLLKYDLPDRLRQVQDHLILYDHLQPAFRGRWTGLGLLKCITASADSPANDVDRGETRQVGKQASRM